MQAMVEEQLRLQQTNQALEDMDKQRVREDGPNNFLAIFFLPTRRPSDMFPMRAAICVQPHMESEAGRENADGIRSWPRPYPHHPWVELV